MLISAHPYTCVLGKGSIGRPTYISSTQEALIYAMTSFSAIAGRTVHFILDIHQIEPLTRSNIAV